MQDPYDHRAVTLDSARLALALRGFRDPEAHYPFLDRARRRLRPRLERLWPRRAARAVAHLVRLPSAAP